MIHSIGVDIIEINRVHEMIERYGDRFLQKVFTDNEIAYCNRKGELAKASSYAARFAAKEAVMKTLGTGWSKEVHWKDIEVQNDGKGKPYLTLYNRAREWTTDGKLHLSISHNTSEAIAFVVWERE